MGYFSNIISSVLGKNFNHFGFKSMEGSTNFMLKLKPEQKLALVLKNPAMLKVFALQCDMFSLGQIFAYENDKELKDHPLLDILRNPNPFQNQQEFLWEFMFWLMLGESQVYSSTNDIEKLIGVMMYNMKPYSIKYPDSMDKDSDKILLSKSSIDKYLDTELRYSYSDGTHFDFPYRNLMSVSDLGTPLGRNKPLSRVDALLKVIQNNEASMDALNINTRYSGKFAVAGTADPDDVSKIPLSETERSDIERKMNDNRPVHATKSMIEIKRFVENAGNQKLDGVYLHTYFVMGSMYNIPKDVLEAFNSGTYENQEKARGSHISYSLQPKGNLLMDKIKKHFGYDDSNLQLYMDWTHLPFMQVFAEQQAKTEYQKTQSFRNLQSAGVPIEDINKFLDTNFTSYGQQQKTGQAQP